MDSISMSIYFHFVPRFKKVRHRTTTLMLPGSSSCAMALYVLATGARSEGADAVVLWKAEYIRESKFASSSV
jgi:hypothetical protein